MMNLRRNNGFTILEVLVAMAILAVAGAAVIRVTSAHLTSVGMIKDATFSSWVAENRLVEIQLDSKWPPANNKTGKTEMAGVEWFWRQQVEKVADKSMRKITVFVLVNENDQQPIYQLSTFLGDPK